jgi:glycolate oxidase iron-sulfur subunit
MNASGCGASVKDYGHALAHDAAYADKARRVSELTRDISELLPDLVPALKGKLRQGTARRLAFHPPCTLQHGQQLRGGVEKHLGEPLGFEVSLATTKATCAAARPAPTACCSPNWRRSCATASWRTWHRCRRRSSSAPTSAASSTCRSGTTTPVRHWVEVLDDALA